MLLPSRDAASVPPSASPSPSPGGGQTSLAMLVQQRELQNSRKLESLVLKNDELAEACHVAQRERRALLERLDYLEARITETCTAMMSIRRETDGRIGAHDSRMAYVEQGCEERFQIVEEAVKELQGHAAQSAQQQRGAPDPRWDAVVGALRLMATRVGGGTLWAELETALGVASAGGDGGATPAEGTALARRVSDLSKELDAVRSRTGSPEIVCLTAHCEELERQLAAHARDLRSVQARVDQWQIAEQSGMSGEMEGRLCRSESKLEGIDARVEAFQEALSRQENLRVQLQQQLVSEQAGQDGRLRSAEAMLVQLQDRVAASASTAAAAQGRADALESRLARVEGFDPRLAEAECGLRGLGARLDHATERAEAAQGREMGREEAVRKLALDVQQLASEVSVVDEKRRQREREEDGRITQVEERLGAELDELRREVDHLRDRAPGVDESRVAALCAELDRGKDVLESIVRMHELKLREKSDEMELRVSALERSIDGVPWHAPAPQQSAQQSPRRRPQTPPAASAVAGRGALAPPGAAHGALPAPAQLPVPSPPRCPQHGVQQPALPRRAGSLDALAAHRSTQSNPGPGAPPVLTSAGPDRSGSALSGRSASPSASRRPSPGGPLTPRLLGGAPGGALQVPPTRTVHAPGGSTCGAATAVPAHEEPGGIARALQLMAARDGAGPAAGRGAEEARQLAADALREQVDRYEQHVRDQEAQRQLQQRGASATPPADQMAEVKRALELRLSQSKHAMEKRRALEAELERINQQLSFIQLAFHAISEKEGTLDESRGAFLQQLQADGSDRARELRERMTRLMDDIRRDKRNVYERERGLVEEGNRLRSEIAGLREGEKQLADEMQRLQRQLVPTLTLG
eukprot:TRINITY_DN35940_c0_g4_i1.p1 TRINITY_DN35940_c0_g4~~TRINITY_DN35940_c0_g4_i1.p1  ORF type:complete len:872 (+),score=280.50 TRINITY_DN35940_c0_g4_i1:87-2702(+)